MDKEVAVKIYTRVVCDIETGAVLEAEGYEYSGPVALCDRSITSQANASARGANATAGGYGSEAGSMFSTVQPTVQRWAQGNTPGYGAMGLGNMLTAAQSAAAGARGAGEEKASLLAQRTGNLAALPASQTATAEATARALGSATQNILAKNAALKEHQQEMGLNEGGNLFGTAGKLQEGALGLQNEFLKTGVASDQAGWLQNAMGLIAASGKAMGGAGAMGGRF